MYAQIPVVFLTIALVPLIQVCTQWKSGTYSIYYENKFDLTESLKRSRGHSEACEPHFENWYSRLKILLSVSMKLRHGSKGYHQ